MVLLDAAIAQLQEAERLEDVQRVVRTSARWMVNADGATFVLRDGDLCYYADEDAMSPLWKGQRFPLDCCISGWAMLHGEVAVVPDIRADPRIPQDAYRPTFVRSLVMVPIRPQEAVGAIGAYWAVRHRASEGEVERLVQLAGATADALTRISPSQRDLTTA